MINGLSTGPGGVCYLCYGDASLSQQTEAHHVNRLDLERPGDGFENAKVSQRHRDGETATLWAA